MNRVVVHDKTFKVFITKDEIRSRVKEMAWEITKKYKDLNPVFVPILNGSFVFAADLVRACNFDSELSFVKIESYKGLSSTGKVDIKFGLDGKIGGRHLIIIEDIVDSGITLMNFIKEVEKLNPASITIASMLLKPEAVQHQIPIDYLGFRIPNAFVIGYGLDYDGLGRTLEDIYQLDEEEK